MGQNGHELEAWGQLRTLSMGPRPLPTTAQRAEAGGGATYYQDRLKRWAYRTDRQGAELLRGMMAQARAQPRPNSPSPRRDLA